MESWNMYCFCDQLISPIFCLSPGYCVFTPCSEQSMFIFPLSTLVEYAIKWRKYHLLIHSSVDGHGLFQFRSITSDGTAVHTSLLCMYSSGVAVPWGMLSFSRQCHTVFHSGGIPLNFPKVYLLSCCSTSSPTLDIARLFLIFWCISCDFFF